MKVALVLIAGAFLCINVYAQGCVAIRHFSCGGTTPGGAALVAGDLSIGTSYRYFRSFRHFSGTEEHPDRVSNNTEVINYAHSLDFNFSYAFSGRTYATMTLPFVTNVRSSLYEHGRDERHSSFSRGLADARVGLGYWLMNPTSHSRLSLAVGLGIKMPTGNNNAIDVFYNVGPEGSPQVRPVDQSIQPGDGGVGITTDFQAYGVIAPGLSWFGGGFYLLSPREMNGIRTFRETLSPVLANEAVMSVPDQYSVRLGLNYAPPSAVFGGSLGVRYEGVPVEDLVGGSRGFRRPGSVFSIEPGVSYTFSGATFNLSVPVAIVRNRPQSITDLETQRLTGNPRNGDAAFADYLINVGFTYRIGTRTPTVPETF